MQERNRQQERARITDDGLGGDDFFDIPENAGMVSVSHGPYMEQLPVASLRVAQVRAHFADRLDIHPEAVALLDGDPVDDTTTLRAGQMLTFIRPAGEKGWMIQTAPPVIGGAW